MWICFVVMAVLGILFLVSGKAELQEETDPSAVKWYRLPFYQSARFLTECFRKDADSRKKERETEKLERFLLILACGMAGVMAVDLLAGQQWEPKEIISLSRPEKGEGDQTYVLEAEIAGETETIQVQLQERRHTQQEKEVLLEKAVEELEDCLLENNESLNEVRGKVSLPASLQNGLVDVQWMQNPEGLLQEDGMPSEDLSEEGELLQLTAVLTCEGKELIHDMALRLFPPLRTAAEELYYRLKRAVQRAEEEGSQETVLQLPDEVDGQKVRWLQNDGFPLGLLPLFVVILAFAGYAGRESEFKKADQERARQLQLDYADVVFKLGMLLGAGMTIQNAFGKAAAGYQETRRREAKTRKKGIGDGKEKNRSTERIRCAAEKKNQTKWMFRAYEKVRPMERVSRGDEKVRPMERVSRGDEKVRPMERMNRSAEKKHRKEQVRWAYEEMLRTCREMESGMPEVRAYENFGRRCGISCYVRLGSLLSGGLQKSAEGLTGLLLEEASAAMEERRQLARKMGEEAGTKLLFPMILMLMVVLVILMVPAMMSF